MGTGRATRIKVAWGIQEIKKGEGNVSVMAIAERDVISESYLSPMCLLPGESGFLLSLPEAIVNDRLASITELSGVIEISCYDSHNIHRMFKQPFTIDVHRQSFDNSLIGPELHIHFYDSEEVDEVFIETPSEDSLFGRIG